MEIYNNCGILVIKRRKNISAVKFEGSLFGEQGSVKTDQFGILPRAHGRVDSPELLFSSSSSSSSVHVKLFLSVSRLRESCRNVPLKHEIPTAAGLGTNALRRMTLQHGCAAGSDRKGEEKFTSRAFCASSAHFLRICEVCAQQRV